MLTAIERFNRMLGAAMGAVVLGVALLQFLIVLTRYMFGFNLIWLQDTVTYGHAMIFMLGAAATLATDAHVRIDIFYGHTSALWRARVNFYGTILFLWPFCLLLFWVCVPYVSESWRNLEGSFQTLGLQLVYLLKSLLLVFPATMMLQGLVLATRAYRDMQRLQGEESLR